MAIDGDHVFGYVATEMQHDGSVCVDFLGVEPEHRGRGVGQALVATACRRGFAEGAAFAHLTVRTSNLGALSIYRSLGFVTERVEAPFRKRFTLA